MLYGRDGLIWGMLNLHSLSTKLLCQATGNDLATLDKIHDVEEEVAGPSVIESMFSASCFQVLLRHETSRSCTEPLMVCPLCGYGREILSRSNTWCCSSGSCFAARWSIHILYLGSMLVGSSKQRSPPFFLSTSAASCANLPWQSRLDHSPLLTFRLWFAEMWQNDWDEAENMTAERIWQQGLVKEGLGLCQV